MKQSQQGDTEAFGEIVEQWSGYLYGIAVWMVRDRLEAEDVVQETLMRAWRGIGGFEAGTSLRAWLSRILANHVSNRRRRKSVTDVHLDVAIDTPDTRRGPEDQAWLTEQANKVRNHVAHLNFEQRVIITLRYYLEYSIPEISEITGWPEGTIKSRMHRALSYLKSAMPSHTVDQADSSWSREDV